MCQICKNPRTRRQALARERILSAEREKMERKALNIYNILKRKQFHPDNPSGWNGGMVARSHHTGELIEGKGFYRFPENTIHEEEEKYLKEENVFYRDPHRAFVFIPHKYFAYIDLEGEKRTKRVFGCNIIFLNPSKEDLGLLRRIGTEVPLP